MKQRIFSHFQDYLIQYISHQYQDLLYCNSSQYILSTYNSQHNNKNNVVLAMTMPIQWSGWVVSCTMSSTLTTILAQSLLTQHYYINRGGMCHLRQQVLTGTRKSIESWKGTKNLVFCTDFNVPTLCQNLQQSSLTCMERGTLQTRYPLMAGLSIL